MRKRAGGDSDSITCHQKDDGRQDGHIGMKLSRCEGNEATAKVVMTG